MTLYEHILEIARTQATAAASGDVEGAIALLARRGELIATMPAAGPADEPVIREILQLDRDIATAIRHRMIAIRDEALALRQGQHAVAGYGDNMRRRRDPRLVDGVA